MLHKQRLSNTHRLTEKTTHLHSRLNVRDGNCGKAIWIKRFSGTINQLTCKTRLNVVCCTGQEGLLYSHLQTNTFWDIGCWCWCHQTHAATSRNVTRVTCIYLRLVSYRWKCNSPKILPICVVLEYIMLEDNTWLVHWLLFWDSRPVHSVQAIFHDCS